MRVSISFSASPDVGGKAFCARPALQNCAPKRSQQQQSAQQTHTHLINPVEACFAKLFRAEQALCDERFEQLCALRLADDAVQVLKHLRRT